MVKNIHGTIFVAVAGRPLLQLAGRSAAEFQKFLPMLLKEIQDPGNAAILFINIISEGFSTDVNM